MRKATRVFANLAVTMAAIGLSAAQLQAAPASAAARQNSAMLKQLVQDGYYDDYYRPACSYGYHYACWYEPYGHRYCACWPGGYRPACPSGYYYACRYDPSGDSNCGCY